MAQADGVAAAVFPLLADAAIALAGPDAASVGAGLE